MGNLEYDSHYHWIIDNGHGRNTKGKKSIVWDNDKQLLEFHFNRAIAYNLFYLLRESNISYTELVPELKDVSLRKRTNRANKLIKRVGKPTIFVSIHGNAFYDHNVKGIETFFYSGSESGEYIANKFQSALINETYWKDRGIKSGNFWVLRKTKMPAILTENGFYTNYGECMKMLDKSWQRRIAYAHFKAIKTIEINKFGDIT